jgi:tetratricopeptide (TPR) repeat protein
LWDRGSALASLERYEEAIADFERAKVVDAKTAVLDDDMLDDAYFSALLGAARAMADVAAGCGKLERYLTLYPSGRHVQDMSDWQKRLRGELKSHFVKERCQ